MSDRNLLEVGIKFHGHKCPAMALGIRTGLAAIKALRVEQVKNKELYCLCETGFAHATMCFADGVQVATGCTFGKSNIEKLDYNKNAITLIDMKSKRTVRVSPNPEFQKKGLSSEFVKLRSQAVEPQDVKPEIVDHTVERIATLPDEELLVVGEVFDMDYQLRKGTFDWHECEGCGEVVFAHGVRIVSGKHLCIRCSGYRQ
jgi:formylmethanofuran dehydrogenase subunit E